MGAVRMNITLPEDVVKILNKKTKLGEKSAFIADAIRAYVEKESHESLMKKMIRGYQASNAFTADDKEWLDADLSEAEDEY
ncbi:MAG: ribbon-helix-helix domain-containing protein [Pseudobdellovibrionaceae bacterium]|jgi:metal-responsive CopG/Arc/MetJ family transcriptional regulator